MELKDLIEYTPHHRELIEEAEEIGLDISLLQNPNKSYTQLTNYYNIQLFDVKNINDKHLQHMNHDIQSCYLRNGYCNIDVNQQNLNLSSQDLALYDYLQIPYTVDDTYETMTEKRLGRKMYGEELDPDIYKYFQPITDFTAREYCRYTVVKEKGLEKYLKPKCHGWNETISELIYLECPNIEQVIDELNKALYTHHIDKVGRCFRRELDLTGRIDIMLDTNYSIDERGTILEVYTQYGIDLRVTDFDISDFTRRALTKQLMDLIIMNNLTVEEMQFYRRQSNLFRDARNNLDKGVSL